MAGVYIHIPFCKQACHYCDFHFSTNTKLKDELIAGLKKEMALRQKETHGWVMNTLYFGGGTPTILSPAELQDLIETAQKLFGFQEDTEITVEANPDDLTPEYLKQLSAETGVNRLSLGVQSFVEEELRWMNRAHNSQEAWEAVTAAYRYFPNLSVDLIYGIPGQSDASWEAGIDRVLELGIPHVSSYALTVEPQTALQHFIDKGKAKAPDEEQARRQFYRLVDKMQEAGYDHYEISNFGKAGWYSRNNSAYWQGKPYLGIGPGAHSFDGQKRGWNVRSNPKYIKSLETDTLPIEWEELTSRDQFNEYLMTRLRTQWGADLEYIRQQFGPTYANYLEEQVVPHIESRLLYWDGDRLLTTREGKYLVDGLAADLFLVNLTD